MFELHITCTKDISELKINFDDGTSVVTERVSKNHDKSDIIDTNYGSETKHEVVDKPTIPDIPSRPAKIDNVLNGLEL